jgi:glyoxylate reductase
MNDSHASGFGGSQSARGRIGLDQMLAHMDIVSVNCPHTPVTYHLHLARRLRLLRPHAILVDTVHAERSSTRRNSLGCSNSTAGPGLHVFEHEPAVDSRLRALDNVVLLPHTGSSTIEGRIAMGERVIINLETFTDSHRPPDRMIGSTS